MDPLLLAMDQGTTSSRAVVFDRAGRIVAAAQSEFPQVYPQPGWVEHDPEAIWTTSLKTAQKAVVEAEAKGGRIAALGVANQRETTIVWDRRTLKPIANAIVWQDRRTSDVCEQLKRAGLEPTVAAKTGLLLDPYFSATKIAWLLDHVDGARAAAEAGDLAFGTVDAFLLARLTDGVHATDATNAARTSLFNIHTNEWDAELLEAFRVPLAMTPSVFDTADDFGETTPAHFGRAIPIRAMVGDQQAAAAGQACFAAGDIKSTYGTGCFVLAETGETPVASKNRLLTTISRRLKGKTYYALEGSIFVAGAAVQWLRDELGLVTSAEETEALARDISSTGGVYMVPAFVGLGAPHWSSSARGALVGLTRGAGRAEIVRAALEAAAYQTADLLGAIARDGAAVSVLKVDGGMAANDWLMQFLADVADRTVERPTVFETTALGAALLAGLGAGVYDSLDEIAALRAVDRRFEPSMPQATREDLLNGWAAALRSVLASA
ncbi:MAG: glycerol kinase GlpK [Pseudomonadota bacterium]